MRTVTPMIGACAIAAVTWMAQPGAQDAPARADVATAKAAKPGGAARLVIPASIEREHKELHERLAAAERAGGKTGPAASRLAGLLRPHLAKEEKFALPPLGMLRAFADGEVPANAEEVIALTQQFRAEYPRMLEEHDAIAAALADLLVVARAENHPETAEFAQELMRHAQSEEEVIYPTAVLIGEYVKLMVAKDAPARNTSPAQR